MGERLKGRIGFASLTNASGRLVDSSSKRVYLDLFPPPTNQYTFTIDPIAVINMGPTIGSNSNWYRMEGDLAKANINAILSVAGPIIVGFIEYFKLDDKEK